MEPMLKSATAGSGKIRKQIFSNSLLFILLLLLVGGKIFFAFLLPQHKALATDLSPENILNAINRERSLRNLITLNTDSRLGAAAQTKADDMMTRHYFAHANPDGQYIWPTIEAKGYKPYLQLGENLAIEFYDTDSLVAAWMNSPTHRENILNEGFRDQGMGLAMGDTGLGQYHSSIANTFGALLISTKPKTAPAAAPAAVSAPAPVTPAPIKTPAKKRVPAKPVSAPLAPAPSTPALTPPVASAETSSTPIEPLQPREGSAGGQNFVIQTTFPTSAPMLAGLPLTQTSPAVVNTPVTPAASGNFNQKFMLVFGGLLLLLMIADIKVAAEKRLAFLDKKINNLAVLVIALIVIAFMYWL
jgi:hypothetical protein